MSYITPDDVNAWTDGVKLHVDDLDENLESSVSTQVLSEASQAYDITSWVDADSTPSLIRKIIAMQYAGWLLERTYSEDDDIDAYGVMLLAQSQKLLDGVAAGTTTLLDAPPGTSLNNNSPVFYPNDGSSDVIPLVNGIPTPRYQWPLNRDTSLGGPYFSMGTIW